MTENSVKATTQIDLVLDLLNEVQERSVELEKRIEGRLYIYMKPKPPVQDEIQEVDIADLVPAIQNIYTKLSLIKDSQTSINSMLNRLEI